jgi:3-deoxy-D-manno-octulosonate 8-phosphate phosphatase (KDO 8-P phosphatase)
MTGRVDAGMLLGVHDGEDAAAPAIPGELAAAVRLLLLDVDGVLTDAGVYVGEVEGGSPIELKRYDIQDGIGIRLLQDSGIEVALVSGRVSRSTALRAEELGLECFQDAGAQKLPYVRRMLDRRGLDWSQAAMLGDDLPDLAVLRRVGLPAAVGNAVPEVRREAVWVGRRSGGRGAVREFARALLDARGEWDKAVEAYVAARSTE